MADSSALGDGGPSQIELIAAENFVSEKKMDNSAPDSAIDVVEDDDGVVLSWTDLCVQVVNWKGEAKPVLHGLTGYAEPGRLMAIMGPSGSGKSTMLDTLAGRLATNTVQTGCIRVNGHKTRLSYGAAAYVTQEDNLTGTLTVRETIWYSAMARLPASDPRRQNVGAVVEGAILEMGLQDCADTPVGNWHLRGVSGGEKRRLSIAIELLLRPRLLFLDEPTSGLDSASAFFVTQTLSHLSRGGRTIVASIHQPSSTVFELFDSLLLLSNGKTIYFGDAEQACNFFKEAGFPCPTLRNPSDHYLRCINTDFDRVKICLKENYKGNGLDPFEKFTTTQIINTLLEYYNNSKYALTTNTRAQGASENKGRRMESSRTHSSFLLEATTLTRRSFVNMARDFGYYWMRLFMYIMVSVCVGTIYYNVGSNNTTGLNYSTIRARGACGAFIFGFVTFMSIGGFPSFVEDMKVFQKERLNGHYGVISFVVANTVSSCPYLLLISIASSSICYFMVGLRPGLVHYLYFMLCLYFSVSVVESLMMAIASVVPNFLMGIIVGAGIQGMFMLVAGYFRLPNDIPKTIWKYPVSYMSFDYWAIQGQSQNDFQGVMFEDETGFGSVPGDLILTQVLQVNTSRSKWVDLIVILSMVFIYRIIFFICIKLSEDATPCIKGYFTKKALRRRKTIMLNRDHENTTLGSEDKYVSSSSSYTTPESTP